MPSFIINALLAGIGLSLVIGPIGCFVVWRRISFIGDTMAHSAIAGVAIALMLDILPFWGVLSVAMLIAAILSLIHGQRWLPLDTWLAILAHSLLAIGLVIFALAKGGSVDLDTYLYGDILTLSTSELTWLYAGIFATIGMFILLWHPLLIITVNAELAQAEGISVRAYNIAFMLLVAFLVAFSVHLIGVLLLTAMMILPAATARAGRSNSNEMIRNSRELNELNIRCLPT